MWLRLRPRAGRALVLAHRYLGIPLSALFVVWFASGIVMMYAGAMPGLTPAERLARQPSIDLARVSISPVEAFGRAGVLGTSTDARMLMVLDRPAYRFGDVTIFADTGERLSPLSRDLTQTLAAGFANVPRPLAQLAGVRSAPDQWTIGHARAMPLHHYRVDDGEGTEVYVSPQRAEVVVVTTRWTRLLAWMGAIPHWLYFEALRTNAALWSRTVIVLATLGSLVALFGLMLAVTQLRPVREARARRARGQSLIQAWIPYGGALRWHHLTGLAFGVFTLTWVFSGLLSMEPYAWTRAQGLRIPATALSGGIDTGALAVMNPAALQPLTVGRSVKEIEFLRVQGDPYFVVTLDPPGRLMVAAESLNVRRVPFTVASILSKLSAAIPEVAITDATVLDSYDAYYYARRDERPLPVVRVKFADTAETWVYVDPATSSVVGSVHRASRVERWLYRGLHSLDFAFWYGRRPVWDAGVIILSLGGLASSGLGVWIGWRRVGRWLRSLVVASAS